MEPYAPIDTRMGQGGNSQTIYGDNPVSTTQQHFPFQQNYPILQHSQTPYNNSQYITNTTSSSSQHTQMTQSISLCQPFPHNPIYPQPQYNSIHTPSHYSNIPQQMSNLAKTEYYQQPGSQPPAMNCYPLLSQPLSPPPSFAPHSGLSPAISNSGRGSSSQNAMHIYSPSPHPSPQVIHVVYHSQPASSSSHLSTNSTSQAAECVVRIRFQHKGFFSGRRARITVLFDGNFLAKIGQGEQAQTVTSPGTHTIGSKSRKILGILSVGSPLGTLSIVVSPHDRTLDYKIVIHTSSGRGRGRSRHSSIRLIKCKPSKRHLSG